MSLAVICKPNLISRDHLLSPNLVSHDIPWGSDPEPRLYWACKSCLMMLKSKLHRKIKPTRNQVDLTVLVIADIKFITNSSNSCICKSIHSVFWSNGDIHGYSEHQSREKFIPAQTQAIDLECYFTENGIALKKGTVLLN